MENNQKTVLFVSEDKKVTEIIERILSKSTFLVVANDNNEALNLLKSFIFDLLIYDINSMSVSIMPYALDEGNEIIGLVDRALENGSSVILMVGSMLKKFVTIYKEKIAKGDWQSSSISFINKPVSLGKLRTFIEK